MTLLDENFLHHILYLFNGGIPPDYFLGKALAHLVSKRHCLAEISAAYCLSCFEYCVCYLFYIEGHLPPVPLFYHRYHCHVTVPLSFLNEIK